MYAPNCGAMHAQELLPFHVAEEFLATGELPDSFRSGIKLMLESEDCFNCDNRKCMDCVLRYMHDNCEDDCPMCCEVIDG